ncbi:hypothetical protein HNP84_005207 [Thermocatellispora tengchongensis]|uniref:Uncharacterized protein n=1 Tax=Thermocatellispora tengchongensis TaxID=1073253 RepID=A0A840PC16_9ACTN|nr:class I SAM-dependent methyltransferase [Thermocatellispora tengchongensis]MBB5135463.1 hypothetical protein [Thermocatellispora tengchongensis]
MISDRRAALRRVEAALGGHPSVGAAVAAYEGERTVVAYVQGATPVTKADLRLAEAAREIAAKAVREPGETGSSGPVGRYALAVAAAAVADFARRRGRAGALRVLEARAGEGEVTAVLVPALSAYEAEYLCTEATESCLAVLRRRFAGRPGVGFGLLDVEEDVRGQGYAPHSHHLVVVSGPDRCSGPVLARLRELVAPGGWLVSVATSADGRGRAEWLERAAGAGFAPLLSLPDEGDPVAGLGAHVFVGRSPVRPNARHLIEYAARRLPPELVPASIHVVDRVEGREENGGGPDAGQG